MRRYLAGSEAIERALAAGEPVRVLLYDRDTASPAVQALATRAQAAGVALWRGGTGDLRRMARAGQAPDAIAMVGPEPRPDLPALLRRRGALWLLDRAAYPSNVGFAIRTAEVSGCEGVIVDADFNHEQRSRVQHVSMGADRVMPVLWEPTATVLVAAARAGYRLIALEDSGQRAPWEIDLTGPVVLLVGNERAGLAAEVLSRCDAVVRLPMAGFVPSYNLQAALSAVALERLRQSA